MAQAATGGGPGTRTVTLQLPDSAASVSSPPAVQPPREEVLSLRLGRRRTKKVSWTAGTVDNELLNKKSSKKCCVFHKDHGFDSDSSDEEGADAGKGTRKDECDGHDHGNERSEHHEFTSGHTGSGGDADGASTSGPQGQF